MHIYIHKHTFIILYAYIQYICICKYNVCTYICNIYGPFEAFSISGILVSPEWHPLIQEEMRIQEFSIGGGGGGDYCGNFRRQILH